VRLDERRFFAVGLDDSLQREMEAALRDSEERSRLAAKSTSDVVWNYDYAADRLTWHGPFERLMQGDPRPAPLTLGAYMQLVHPDDRARTEAECGEASRRGGAFGGEHRVIRAGGQVRHWFDRGVVLLDSCGQPRRRRSL
jgi:PAS domain-containing protein